MPDHNNALSLRDMLGALAFAVFIALLIIFSIAIARSATSHPSTPCQTASPTPHQINEANQWLFHNGPYPDWHPCPPPTPTPQPTTLAVKPTVVWKAGDPTLGKWEVANTYQCGVPIQNNATFTFNLKQNGQQCGRNQANPLREDGNLVLMNPGETYTWKWKEIDGPSPGMGPDAEAESLVWQIHGLNEPHTPCTSLNFQNGTNDIPPGPQMWAFRTCAGIVWTGAYTPGETDHWKIKITLALDATGVATLWRNGTLQGTWHGATFHDATQAFWNFGPYKWRWELPGEGGSTMTEVNQTYIGMTQLAP